MTITRKPTIVARVNAGEFEVATEAARKITLNSDHTRQAAEIAERLRAHTPDTLSGLIRVICGLAPAPRPVEAFHAGDEARTLKIRIRVTDAEREVVERFLDEYPRRRRLTEQIEEQLRRFAPVRNPAQLVRAVVGLDPTRVGAPEGSKNALRRKIRVN